MESRKGFIKIGEMFVYSRNGKMNKAEEKRRTDGGMSFINDNSIGYRGRGDWLQTAPPTTDSCS